MSNLVNGIEHNDKIILTFILHKFALLLNIHNMYIIN